MNSCQATIDKMSRMKLFGMVQAFKTIYVCCSLLSRQYFLIDKVYTSQIISFFASFFLCELMWIMCASRAS